ncbi:hypothetical protein [Paenibacillus thiaminolyticus]|uniref:Uncharacterized protein n=1 Tax=Paenibacillus thiaminolyticus TaxID=49283 RepID=A0A3A3GY30_PANTH|nr:hypothetical protein [Paenibacillus thiaminolyticus]RJG23081.1 hypothetical protein DQX05_14485 [Paenibacillus thiaminolyticus]
MIIKKRKKFIYVFLLSVLTLAGLYYFFIYNSYKGEVRVDSTYIESTSTEDLINRAELIVIGTPVNNFEERKHVVSYYNTMTIQDFYTITDMEVEQVLKGQWNNKNISVIEPVSILQGFDGRRKLVSDDYVEMKKGNRYIVTLKKNSFGDYSVINMNNGVFNLNSTSFHNKLTFEENKNEEMKNELSRYYNIK